MTIILSIDVGMKNLAYCRFSAHSTGSYCIYNWGVINLCGDDEKKCTCYNKKKEAHHKTNQNKCQNSYDN